MNFSTINEERVRRNKEAFGPIVLAYLDRTYKPEDVELLCYTFADKISHSRDYWMLPIMHVFELDVADNSYTYTSDKDSDWSSVDELLSADSLGTCVITGCQTMLAVMFGFPCVMLVDHLIDSDAH